MKIEEIDKWLDNEYGVSYTRLEELHDFVVEQDMKHQEEAEKEIERLNNALKEYDRETYCKLINENRKLKNIINELEKDSIAFKKFCSWIVNRHEPDMFYKMEIINKLQELKGVDKE